MFWDASQAYSTDTPNSARYANSNLVITDNGRFDAGVKNALLGGSSAPPPSSSAPHSTVPPTTVPPTSTSHTSSAPSPTTSSPASGGSCAGVNTWVSNVAVSTSCAAGPESGFIEYSHIAQYNGGDQVMYNGHLWTAKWWSYGDTPGGICLLE